MKTLKTIFRILLVGEKTDCRRDVRARRRSPRSPSLLSLVLEMVGTIVFFVSLVGCVILGLAL